MLAPDGKIRLRDTLDTQGILRLIESVPSAKAGGEVAKTARDDLEKKLGESVVSNNNKLNYKYLDDNKMLEE